MQFRQSLTVTRVSDAAADAALYRVAGTRTDLMFGRVPEHPFYSGCPQMTAVPESGLPRNAG